MSCWNDLINSKKIPQKPLGGRAEDWFWFGKAANLLPSLAGTKLVGEDKPNRANGKNCRLWETTGHTQNCINCGTIKMRRQVHETGWERVSAAGLQELHVLWEVVVSGEIIWVVLPPHPNQLWVSHLNNYVHKHKPCLSFTWRSFTWGSYNGFRELVPSAFSEIYCLWLNLPLITITSQVQLQVQHPRS